MLNICQLGISPKSAVVVPVVTSSVLLTIGVEALGFMPILKDPVFSEEAASRWFKYYFYKALFPICSLGTASIVTGVLAYRRGYGKLFGYGAVFSALHFAYVPIIMYPCQCIIENNQTKAALRKWLKIHKFRLVSDIAATVCFTTALYNYITK
ncbi:hypothetical protein K501DRAFT_80702 [Backusella circina FSU 941]|nr:hypothetical protein K501DRAFT_80702 [Backusella circina FSU 941]